MKQIAAIRVQSRRRIWVTMAVVACLALAEVVVGIRNGSLALVSDASHLTTDLATLAITSWALGRAQRPADADHTFGYLRSGILVATLNALALLGVAVAIGFSAYNRFNHPVTVTPVPVLVVAVIAFICDASMAWMLRTDRELSVRSAAWHFVGDGLASASVIAASLIILTTGWRGADPSVSLIIAALIAAGGIALLRETTSILHESTPRDIDAEEVRRLIAASPGIEDVHDLHIWSLDRGHRALTTHVSISDQSLQSVTAQLREIENLLCERFGIEHVTIQPETPTCANDAEPYCSIDERHERHVAAVYPPVTSRQET